MSSLLGLRLLLARMISTPATGTTATSSASTPGLSLIESPATHRPRHRADVEPDSQPAPLSA
ncbi:MAG: hypothetical protein ACXVWZ_09925 [Nocardioides sp.]